ncbi:hypothetical protein HWV62_28816 [Athelia sp. TMB]|nr:hypothetical protein HWV62_28816 [Athelia sp. TMB]
MKPCILALLIASSSFAHNANQVIMDAMDIPPPSIIAPEETWLSKYGKPKDMPFSGPLSFSHLPYAVCLEDESARFDIAILGFPFDTAVSYRAGARFGPFAIRAGSRRQRDIRGYTLSWGINPFDSGATVIDCGDIPISPFDNALALDQMEVAYSTLLNRPILGESAGKNTVLGKDGLQHARIVSLGGDHTIVLPILRSLNKIYGQPISVIHFDAHLDTWPGYPGQNNGQSRINHGTFFAVAQKEGLISNTSIHAGIRCKMAGMIDIEHDQSVGFELITTDDIDDLGIPEIIRRIRTRIGDSPVYLSFDIDVIDPGMAPATGTPEAGGLNFPYETYYKLSGLSSGADIVEVAPAYDHGKRPLPN